MRIGIIAGILLMLVMAVGAGLVRLESYGYERGKMEERAEQLKVIALRNKDIEELNKSLEDLSLSQRAVEPVVIETVRETVKEIVIPAEAVPSTALPGQTLKAIDKIGSKK
jgi:hypothetical protein